MAPRAAHFMWKSKGKQQQQYPSSYSRNSLEGVEKSVTTHTQTEESALLFTASKWKATQSHNHVRETANDDDLEWNSFFSSVRRQNGGILQPLALCNVAHWAARVSNFHFFVLDFFRVWAKFPFCWRCFALNRNWGVNLHYFVKNICFSG